MTKNKGSGMLVVGMLIGGAIGTVAGLLAAPRSGKETRRILKKSADALPEMAEDLSTTMQLQADRLSASTVKNWNETLNRLKDAIAVGIEASQSVDIAPDFNDSVSLDSDVNLSLKDTKR